MTRRTAWAGLLAACVTAGCVSTTINGYMGGSVKYSQISYNYTAKPVLSGSAGKTYMLETDETPIQIASVPALEKLGVTRTDGDADIQIIIKSGKISHEAGGAGMGGSYQPALISKMPVQITVKDKGGNVVLDRSFQHENIATMSGAGSFKSREEAKAAMSALLEVAKSGADENAIQSAAQRVNKELSLLAKDLFEPRNIQVSLPAIRSAGTVDMEAAYTLLAEAKGDEQVNNALAAYVALGVEHKKADGTDDVVGIYGVLCGMASAKILVGDLAGAYLDAKKAWDIMPDGKEHRLIVLVLKQQQEQAGVEIIPEEDYDKMVGAEKTANSLKNLFGGKK